MSYNDNLMNTVSLNSAPIERFGSIRKVFMLLLRYFFIDFVHKFSYFINFYIDILKGSNIAHAN